MKDPITFHLDQDGIGWVTFDDPDSKANIFNPKTVACLHRVLDVLSEDASLKVAVIQSGKDNVFIAGGDLYWMASLETADLAMDFENQGHPLMNKIAAFRVPVIASIHSVCVGGGYELALACHYRMASDSPKTRIGLPEVALGIVPGWGGSVRLPRLVGARRALGHILCGIPVGAPEAKALGMIDELAPAHLLRERTREAAFRLVSQKIASPGWHFDNLYSIRKWVCSAFRHSALVRKSESPHAALAAIEIVEKSLGLSLEAALDYEKRRFCEIAPLCESREMILRRCRERKEGKSSPR